LWAYAKDRGTPKLQAPDWTKAEGAMRVQTGRRAVRHITKPGEPIPNGWRVYGTCRSSICMNPEHTAEGSTEQWGKQRAATGVLKGDVGKQAQVRAMGRRRSVLTEATFLEVTTSPESGTALAKRLGVSRATISKARLGQMPAFSAGNPFAGLGAR
jgi:hypothetical protein